MTDGDTIRVLVGQRTVKVRPADIDAPERNQPFGQWAKQVLSGLIFGRSVEVDDAGLGCHGRTLGTARVGNTDVGAVLVRSGAAWVCRHYSDDPAPVEAEADARRGREGLWASPAPIPS